MQLLFIVLIFFSVSSSFAMRVIVDPGHGGSDKGATFGAHKEANISLSVSKKLAQLLDNDERFDAILTREKDQFLALEDRAAMANKKGDVFISIHVNSSDEIRARGFEIYFQNQLPPDEEILFLASRENKSLKIERSIERAESPTLKKHSIQNADVRNIIEDLERSAHLTNSGSLAKYIVTHWAGLPRKVSNSNSIRQAPFFVVNNTDMPAVLIEIGYITNPREFESLILDSYQEKVARGIYNALVSFKEFVDKQPTKSLN